MPLLLLPLLLVGLVLLWLVLLPVLLLQRYRMGRARRQVIGWMAQANAWLLLASSLLLLMAAWASQHWVADALTSAATGLGVGGMLGVLGVWLARIEHSGGRMFHTPNRWLVLLLVTVVAARIALGLWQGWLHVQGGGAVPGLLADQGSLFALGGLLLGHYCAYAWGLRRAWRAAR